MRRLLVLALLLFATALACAQPVPQGQPQLGKPPRDRDFGIRTGQFGLEREVEMYQWRADDDGYEAVWNSARIDSSQFEPGHLNPPAMPIEGRRWWADGVTLDGRPLDPDVLRVLGTWRRFRPNFSRLPVNLAASFQPEGDGLASSENPLQPRIGDVRVHWRELVLPALDGKLELRDGGWRLTREATVPAARPEAVIEIPDVAEIAGRDWWPWLLAGLVVGAGVWMSLRRRRRVPREEG